MTPIDTVWNRMKACAADCVSRGERPGRFRAEAIVIRYMHEERVSPWPPPEVIHFFGSELLGMIDRAREREADPSQAKIM